MDKTKKPVTIEITGFFGAADQIRTGDLILTKNMMHLMLNKTMQQIVQLSAVCCR